MILETKQECDNIEEEEASVIDNGATYDSFKEEMSDEELSRTVNLFNFFCL